MTDSSSETMASTEKKEDESNCTLRLEKVVSSGQTGADKAALVAAKEFGLKTGGWAVRGYITSKGVDMDLRNFGLMELPGSNFTGKTLSYMYVCRSIKNAEDSSATLAFLFKNTPGTRNTIGYCVHGRWNAPFSYSKMALVHGVRYSEEHMRPVMVIRRSVNLDDPGRMYHFAEDARAVKFFLEKYKVKTLNVCGNREMTQTKEFEKAVGAFLFYLFTHLGFSKSKK